MSHPTNLMPMFTFIGMTAGQADGQFTVHTEVKVRDFQSNNGLTPNGVVDASTWKAIEAPKSFVLRTIASVPLLTLSTIFVILLV